GQLPITDSEVGDRPDDCDEDDDQRRHQPAREAEGDGRTVVVWLDQYGQTTVFFPHGTTGQYAANLSREVSSVSNSGEGYPRGARGFALVVCRGVTTTRRGRAGLALGGRTWCRGRSTCRAWPGAPGECLALRCGHRG